MVDNKVAYSGANVLITGGNGFMGRNLAEVLTRLEAKVTVSDIVSGGRGEAEKAGFAFEVADITDGERIAELVVGRDYVFDLAGLSGVAESNAQPLRHFKVNCIGHLTILEACRTLNPGVKLFFPSSQLVYGRPASVPVAENAPTNPKCVYGIQKLSIEYYFRLYFELYGLKTSCLRISNPYGPGQKSEQPYGVVNNFVLRALRGDVITIFGDGKQIRDFVFIDDVISAILAAAASPSGYGRVLNCGGPEQTSLMDLAKMITDQAGSGSVKTVPWPEEARKADVGDIFLDKTEVMDTLGWRPETGLANGIGKTVESYA